jgi:exosortase
MDVYESRQQSQGVLNRSQGLGRAGLHRWIRWGLVGVLFWMVFHVEIARIVRVWMHDVSWSHGFLIPVFSLYLVHQRRQALLSLDTIRPCYTGLVLLIAAIAFYVFNVVSPSGYAYFRSVAVVGALASIVLLLGGWSVMRLTWLPVAYLMFAVPLPQRYYVSLTLPMRQMAATVAAALLNLSASVHTSVNGVVIDVIYQGRPVEPSLNVAEACSGMRLLMAFVALGVAMAYLHARPVWQRIVLVVMTIPIALFCNIVRVTVTGFLYVFVHPKYTHGLYHDALGMAMLPLALGLYSAVAWFMSSLFVDEHNHEDVVVSSKCRVHSPKS